MVLRVRPSGLLFPTDLDWVVWLTGVADFFLCLDAVAPEAKETIPASRKTAAAKIFNLLQLPNCTSLPFRSPYSNFKMPPAANGTGNCERTMPDTPPLMIGQREEGKVADFRARNFCTDFACAGLQ